MSGVNTSRHPQSCAGGTATTRTVSTSSAIATARSPAREKRRPSSAPASSGETLPAHLPTVSKDPAVRGRSSRRATPRSTLGVARLPFVSVTNYRRFALPSGTPGLAGCPERGTTWQSSRWSPPTPPTSSSSTTTASGAAAQRLNKLGISPNQARSTALFQLATEIPAAILARTLGIHTDVAVTWQRHSAGDWASYAAEVSREPRHSNSSNI